ncbi:hypothetical protein GCT13_30855 [Paraburkholderia sp. CNPSo 3157]|uniref:Uncharacterized protein n=1 Tax=Paraburkholderia franconis TaxID=2654983 RepID=A0A7X1NFV6_9BURK|nr:hypothetical protein [Paraburkholderia franconis]MPW21160.1 hypothetical protein [Paraburkholderia franconis]
MRRFTHAAIALLFISSASVAQQPMTVPGRSQSPGQQTIDSALCYADANKTTHVNMAHESQRPPPPNQAAQTAPRPIVAPAPVNPPLPAAMGASGASAAVAASAASAPVVASGATAASGTPATTVAAASGASGAAAASGAEAASGASTPMPASPSLAEMPPPPPPEPPMVRYWAAYSKCMQQRGYYTR